MLCPFIFIIHISFSFRAEILDFLFVIQELAVPLRNYLQNFPNKNFLHPYERSLIDLTLGDGIYEEVIKHLGFVVICAQFKCAYAFRRF